MAVGVAGVAIMLEATRRAMGMGMLVTTGFFILFVFAGPFMPEVIQHKGASLQRFVSHMWLTTEGVYGVALGVSVQFIFLFVLFGTLLDLAGAGNYMMQISLALLGHLRGGPAKVAVVSSALNGLVSGSSVSNVVSGGIFTIPLMKRTGYSGVKAGAIEAASSINGQIMPPVMGAAAFLMVEYVGIPYTEIIKHAALPAVISYIALFYIVHLEALKYDLKAITRTHRPPLRERAIGWALGITGTLTACAMIYYLILFVRWVFGDCVGMGAGRRDSVRLHRIARVLGALPGLAAGRSERAGRASARALADDCAPGLHFFIPIVVLLWCLMVEELSPATSAFWATATSMAMVVATPALLAAFRRTGAIGAAWRKGFADLWQGLVLGARNMIGIAVACASAGLIVGAITLTGMGLMMTDFVEYISAGQRACDAGADGGDLPAARRGRPHDRELHPGRDADGAGDRRAWRAQRSRHSADRRAPLRLLLRHHGGRHAAGGPGLVRRGRDLRRRPEPDRAAGDVVQHAHGAPALRVHLQPADSVHRCR